MKSEDALMELLHRVAAAGGASAWFSGRELADWPAAPLGQLKAAGLLFKGPPADAVTCPGCEEDCTMPVEVAVSQSGAARAFVFCDKRDDVGRVTVPVDLLEQWVCSPERLADGLAALLGIRRGTDDLAASRWEVGLLKGAKHSAHVVLGIDRDMQLGLAGHAVALADVLDLGEKGLSVDRRALLRCVDNPVAGGGETESAEQRRERLKARVAQERSRGTKAFLRVVAEEEGFTVSRLKQLIYEKPEPSNKWTAMLSTAGRASPKKSKTKM